MIPPNIMKKNLTWALLAWIIVTCGFARAQVVDATQLWFQWMANPVTDGPRLYLRTEREILQTGFKSATFQSGTAQFVLADGGVGAIWRDQIIPFYDEWDTDRDGWRDVVEIAYQNTVGPTPAATDWAFDGRFQPPAATFAPDVLWTQLGDGTFLPVNPVGGVPATLVRPFAVNNVYVSAAPPSDFPRGAVLTDYSTQYYFTNQASSSFELYGLSLYSWNRSYPTPSDGARLEKQIVPGDYTISFPTVSNAYVTSSGSVTHRMVPNGTLHIGEKKPTWLIRKVETLERIDQAPVPQSWSNGRLVFDPNLPNTFHWDNLVLAGLAIQGIDQISMEVEDDTGIKIWPPISGSLALNVGSSQVTLNMGLLYGVPGFGRPLSPLSENGTMVFRYSRSASGSAGDLSSVTLRIPVEFRQSYESWRRLFFFGNDATNDSISGPDADPDGDGFNNQTEFNNGTDPSKKPYFVTTSGATNIGANTATILGSTGGDGTVAILSRGVVYSETSQNPAPQLGGLGVINFPVAGPGDFQANLVGLDENTTYSYRAYIITGVGLFYSSPIRTFTTVQLAVVDNPTVTDVTVSSAVLGGTVVSSGGQTVTQRGVVYSPTASNDSPFLGGANVTSVSTSGGLGVFTVGVNGLTIGTEYSFRAYAITSAGVAYSDVAGFSTPGTLPTIEYGFVNSVSVDAATFIAFITSNGGSPIAESGIVLSQTSFNNNPQIGGLNVLQFVGVGIDVVSTAATGLTPGTTYSFRAYATNAVGTAYDPVIGTFTTPSPPIVINPTATNVTATSALLGGTVTSNGGAVLTQRGVVYSSTDTNPQIGGLGVFTKPATGTSTGVFTVGVSGLSPGTLYYVRAYATNAAGTSYTPTVAQFTTLASVPTLNAPTISAITATSATLGATVTSDGGATIIARGIIYSLSSVNSNPTIGGPGVTNVPTSGTLGTFTVDVTGLQGGSQYTFKAYAINSAGVGYGSPWAFFTTFTVPSVAIGDITNITASEATVDGFVTSDGGRTVTEFGVVYSESPNPVVGGPGVFQVAGSGNMAAYSVNLSGLNAATQYYVRAYAFNEGGYGYSGQETFDTPASILPLLGSPQVNWIDETIAAEAPQEASPDGEIVGKATIAGTAESEVRIPEFIYKKHESELGLSMTYHVQTSSDNKAWVPLDLKLWSFHNEPEVVKAIWSNPEVRPPGRIFFRMSAKLDGAP